VYPNPVKNILNIVLKESMIGKPLTIYLIAMDGKIVKTRQLLSAMATETIELSNTATGKYQLRIATDKEVMNKIVEVIR
jgi:hypothetical protein